MALIIFNPNKIALDVVRWTLPGVLTKSRQCNKPKIGLMGLMIDVLMTDDIIKLAEWQHWYVNGNRWENKHLGAERPAVPNPLASDTDCMELVRFLNGKGWFFLYQDEGGRKGDELIKPMQTLLRFHRHRPYKSFEWRGTDYKQGVVELALRVKDSE
jgi:hypothetical protein